MPRCPRCSGEAPNGSRFCPSCAAPIEPASIPTRTSLDHEKPTEASTPVSHPSVDRARFAPGDMLERRYRIVALLGRGGMGEVYRADDLKLGQPVALKFLPAVLERDAGRLERFLDEVRIARQVSHPNVCRMYDVAETGGQHFLSMEYVDGEDLASLLRRIGRLPEDSAVHLARQICAGLAAAHAQGILHRDLKPANVMIDGRGRARLTDFGLAGLADSFEGAEIRAGTPAYMAPEQLEGREVTRKSEIYSLGLVLYELFTGKPAFPASSLEQLRRVRRESIPSDPTSLVRGLDPAVERIILQCLEVDPEQRPSSALAVSAALPGGDPLAAALAAGETPSPEMVAAAGDVGGLRPATGTALLAAVLLGLLAITATYRHAFLAGQLDLPESPEALAFEARRIIADAGHAAPAVDRAYGFVHDDARLAHARENEGARGDWSRLLEQHPGPVLFWYRQSPRYLVPIDLRNITVTETDPAPLVAGMVALRLDPQGRLLRLHAVPEPVADADAEPAEADWAPLLEHAGLEPEALTPATPQWVPPVYCDHRRSWVGRFPDQPDVPVRVEAGALRGRPVYFEVVLPWSQSQQSAAEPRPLTIDVIALALLLVMLLGAVLLARANLRLGRGDRRGAFRLAVFIFVCNTLIALFGAHHVPTFSESRFFFQTLAWGLMIGSMVWIAYLGLEPHARRLWPDILISWSRLLAGRMRDPLIGRDLLIGGAAGVVSAVVQRLTYLLPPRLGLPIPEPASGQVGGFPEGALVVLESIRHMLAMVSHLPQLVVSNTLGGIFLLILIRVVVRKRWLAVALTYALLFTVGLTLVTNPVLEVPIVLVSAALFVGVLIRFGMLAAAGMMLVLATDQFAVLTLDPSAWYAGRSLFVLSLVAAVFVYAFYISLGRRRLLSGLETPARP